MAEAIHAVSARYVERWAAIDPLLATEHGVVGFESQTTDYSPAGISAREALCREALDELDSLGPAEGNDRLAIEVLRSDLTTQLAAVNDGEAERDINVIASPWNVLQMSFDLLATNTEDDWAIAAERLAAVPAALEGLIETYRLGLARGNVAARRQALAAAEQLAERAMGRLADLGVPGHHLQVAEVVHDKDALTRHQMIHWMAGHGEGWALYAERLMGELGYLDNPDYELGMLIEQLFRALRVVVDIGLHLELEIPGSIGGDHGGQRWTPDLAIAFLADGTRSPGDMIRSEVDRYLGWPGQAISYKVGERAWLDGREALRRRYGAAFDLREFHRRAPALGSMGLDQFAVELDRLEPIGE